MSHRIGNCTSLRTSTSFSTKNQMFLVFGTIQQRNPFLRQCTEIMKCCTCDNTRLGKARIKATGYACRTFIYDFSLELWRGHQDVGKHLFSVTCSLGFIPCLWETCGTTGSRFVETLQQHQCLSLATARQDLVSVWHPTLFQCLPQK